MDANALEQKLLLNNREAANALGVSERTLFKLVKEKALPVTKIDRFNRYFIDDLKAWAAGQSRVVDAKSTNG